MVKIPETTKKPKREQITLSISPEIRSMLLEQSSRMGMSASRYLERLILDTAYRNGYSFRETIADRLSEKKKG